jgi:hypothetical protein
VTTQQQGCRRDGGWQCWPVAAAPYRIKGDGSRMGVEGRRDDENLTLVRLVFEQMV